ncbi:MAG: dihydrofolate reductase [Actinobacteria bacterium]|nr:dihydrofolate reductase [Actinomycetota bacterium]
MRVVVVNHLTLDGVMQGPGHADEDRRGDFKHGGWAAAADAPRIAAAYGERLGTPGGALLMGRRSYEGMLGGWNERGGPFKHALNAAPKYVASRSPDTRLEWPNSTLLSGDTIAAVRELRGREGGNLAIMGSGELIRSLLPHGLIDELLLVIHPLILGDGLRLFEDGESSIPLHLRSAEAVEGGVIITAYEPG